MHEEQPQSWSEVAGVGLEVASAVLGSEPPHDSRPWVAGAEAERKQHDDAAAQAPPRLTKHRRAAWLREKEVAWWEGQAAAWRGSGDREGV